jgi:hypothetical protein
VKKCMQIAKDFSFSERGMAKLVQGLNSRNDIGFSFSAHADGIF